MDNTLIFAGQGSRKLTERICSHLGLPVGQNETITFSEGNTFVRILDNVRGRDTFIVQTTVYPANDNFMELLFYVDALKRASARSVTAVIPYFSYAKGDKKDEPRVSIRARVCADALEAAGVDRVVTLDLHAPQIQGFFSVPVDNLMALPILADRLMEEMSDDISDVVIVAADTGYVKEAREYATYLGCPVAIADKMRAAHDDSAEVLGILGSVEGRKAVIVDDFAISCKTLCGTAQELLDMGATEVYAAITHGVFTPSAMDLLMESRITRLFVTDTIETQPTPLCERVETVSIDGLLSEAIRRIGHGESLSSMFDWTTRARFAQHHV
ncbi:MAG: ribose-phosphate diphosphokinase [Acidimicrobiia bacterium]|nr:ribose-phosphate diphosphokinase [Acidimicrobiia bacterium]